MIRTPLVLALLALTTAASAADPVDVPLFELAPGELSALGDEGTDEIEVYLEEHQWDLDTEGRWTQAWRRRFVVRSEQAAQGMAMLEHPWVPEREARPQVRARVVDRAGKVWEADPTSFQEAVDTGESPDIVQDTRTLRVPLPGMAPGSMVEQEVVVREEVSLSRVARTVLFPTDLRLPAAVHRLVITAPAGTGLRSEAPDHVSVERTEQGGRERLVFTIGEREPADHLGWPQVPDALRLEGIIRVGTRATWAEVAADYHRTLAAVPTGDIRALVARVDAAATEDEKIALATAIARDEVRYTSIAFGMGRVVPRTPATTHGSSFGDCKDKALLLSKLLTATGIDARVALLATRDGIPFDDTMPSLDLFDHAIVYLPERDVWIDATSDWSAAGELPWMDQDRPALVVHPDDGALLRTPEQPATYQVTTRVEIDEPGRGSLSEVTTASGWPATRVLSGLGTMSEVDRERALVDYVRNRYGVETATVELSSEPGPARLAIVSPGATAATANTRGGRANLDLSSIAEQMEPASLTEVAYRTAPLDGVPAVHRAVIEVRMPEGYTLDAPIDDGTWTIGDATLSRTATVDGRDLSIVLQLDTGDGDFESHELVELEQALLKGQELPPLTWTAPGYGDGAVSRLRTLLAKPEPDGPTQLEIATLLQNLGLREAAQPFAEAAAAALPSSAHAQGLAGLLLSGARDPGAIRYLEAAYALDPYWGGAVLAWGVMGPDQVDHNGDEDPALRDRVYGELVEAGTVDPELAQGVWLAWQREGRWADLLEVEELPDHLKQAARYMSGEPTGQLVPAAGLALIGAGHEEGFPLLNQLPAARLPTFYRGVRKLADLTDPPSDAVQAAALAYAAIAVDDRDGAETWLRGGYDRFRSDLLEGAGLMGGDLDVMDDALQRKMMHSIVLSAEAEPHGDQWWGVLPVNDNRVPLFVAWKEGDDWRLTYPSGDGLVRLLDDRLADDDLDGALALANWAMPRPEPLRTRAEVLAITGLTLLPEEVDQAVERLVEANLPWAPYEAVKRCTLDTDWACELAVTSAFPDPELQFLRAVSLAETGNWRKARKVARSLTGSARDEAMAVALTSKGDWDELEKVVARGQVDVDRWTNDLAWGLLLDGRPTDALPHALRSLDIRRDPPLLHTLASAYVMLERYDEAAELYSEVQGLVDDPDPDWAYVQAKIAQSVGLDPDPIWDRLDEEVAPGPRSTRRLPRK